MKSEVKKFIFAATGKFEHFTRESLKSWLEERGHTLLDKISSKADYLINNDVTSTSGKNKFAKENQIQIISEAELMKLIGDVDSPIPDTSSETLDDDDYEDRLQFEKFISFFVVNESTNVKKTENEDSKSDEEQSLYFVRLTYQHHNRWNDYTDEFFFFNNLNEALKLANDTKWEGKKFVVGMIKLPNNFETDEYSRLQIENWFNLGIYEDFDEYDFIDRFGQIITKIYTDGWIDFSHEPEIDWIIHWGDFLGDFIDGQISIYLKPDRTHITNLTIPATICNLHECFDVVKIKEKAFSNLEHLEEVTIENNEIEIGAGAFEGCRKLKSLILNGSNIIEKIDNTFKSDDLSVEYKPKFYFIVNQERLTDDSDEYVKEYFLELIESLLLKDVLNSGEFSSNFYYWLNKMRDFQEESYDESYMFWWRLASENAWEYFIDEHLAPYKKFLDEGYKETTESLILNVIGQSFQILVGKSESSVKEVESKYKEIEITKLEESINIKLSELFSKDDSLNTPADYHEPRKNKYEIIESLKFIVRVEFDSGKTYTYNSEIPVNKGDIVLVSGKIQKEGKVVSVTEGWENSPWMQEVIKNLSTNDTITFEKYDPNSTHLIESLTINHQTSFEDIYQNLNQRDKDVILHSMDNLVVDKTSGFHYNYFHSLVLEPSKDDLLNFISDDIDVYFPTDDDELKKYNDMKPIEIFNRIYENEYDLEHFLDLRQKEIIIYETIDDKAKILVEYINDFYHNAKNHSKHIDRKEMLDSLILSLLLTKKYKSYIENSKVNIINEKPTYSHDEWYGYYPSDFIYDSSNLYKSISFLINLIETDGKNILGLVQYDY